VPRWLERNDRAYRFLGNPEIDWTEVMAPHWQCTGARMRSCWRCRALPTRPNWTSRASRPKRLGPLSDEAQAGMYLHPTYTLNPDREPLRVVDAWMWAREANGQCGGLKESVRLIESISASPNIRRRCLNALVNVTDRGGDVTALMKRADGFGHPADWLIRSQHTRKLDEAATLWETVQASVRSMLWRLLSNREAHDVDAVVELIAWYRARWKIEMFFRILKNGWKVEALQLSQIDRVERPLALYMVTAHCPADAFGQDLC
jgi:Transposase DDE domain